jgi:murein L,D-transpeptidase YafK
MGKISKSAVRITLAVLIVCLFLYIAYSRLRSVWYPYYAKYYNYTVNERIQHYGEAAKVRFLPYYKKASVSYPPKELGFVIIKDGFIFELWARDDDGPEMKFIRSYRLTAYCGRWGPKMKEGDCQIPEGIYKISGLNPNSSYHLSLKVNYPNSFDREMGKADGRTNLGSLIFIHGKDVTIGCVPIGDEAIEEIFVMAAETGKDNIEVLMSPVDFRKDFLLSGLSLEQRLPKEPEWVSQLYENIKTKMMTRYNGGSI